MTFGPSRSRRSFLGVMATMVAAFSLPALAWSRRHEPAGTVDFPVDQIVTDRLGASDIGLEYLKAFPAEADPVWLAGRLSESVAPTKTGTDRPGELRRAFEARQVADFESGDVVTVCGWVLSRTEARLCALSAVASS